MEEDEEVYLENNQIHQYLSSHSEYNGFYNVVKLHASEAAIDRCTIRSSNMHMPTRKLQYNDKVLHHQQSKVMECGLILEEDAQYVESMGDLYIHGSDYGSIQPSFAVRNKILLVASISCASFLCCTFKRRLSIPLGISAALYSIWKFYLLKQQKHQLQQTEEFLATLHHLFQVLKRATQLVQENEVLARGNTLVTSSSAFSSLPIVNSKNQLMLSLRFYICDAIEQMVYILSKGTKLLIKSLPLNGQLDLDHNYLATIVIDPCTFLRDKGDLPLSTLKHNYSVYLLIQSEFLRRLALCFSRKLWLYNLPHQLKEIGNITSQMKSQTTVLVENLRREYEIVHTFGLTQERKFKVPSPSWNYSDVYVAAHSAVLHLRAMMMNTCAIEKLLEKDSTKNQTEIILDDIENAFENIISESDSFNSCCKEGLAQLRKLKLSSLKSSPEIKKPVLEKAIDEVPTMHEDYVIEDEVFEATSLSNELIEEGYYPNGSIFSTKEEKAKQSIENQLSLHMVKELKTVLITKSLEWKERERKALLKKNRVNNSSDSDLLNLPSLPCDGNKWPLPRLKTSLPKKSCAGRQKEPSIFTNSLTSSIKMMDGNSEYSHPCNSPELTTCNSPNSYTSMPTPPPLPQLFSSSPPLENTSRAFPSDSPKGLRREQSRAVMEESILKGAHHFWSQRNQLCEEIFSGSGENVDEECDDVTNIQSVSNFSS